MDIKHEDVVGCWACLPGGGYFELREDGMASRKLRGGGDFSGTIRWQIQPPDAFTLDFRPTLTGPGASEGQVSYRMVARLVRHDRREMQLDVTHFDSQSPGGMNTGIQFWKRSKRPATWERASAENRRDGKRVR